MNGAVPVLGNTQVAWYLAGFLGTALLAWPAVGIARQYALRAGVLDQPGARQSHTQPTPRGGGLGMLTALCLISLAPGLRTLLPALWGLALLPALLLLGLVGWLDDRRGLSPWSRLAVQFVVSIALLVCIANTAPTVAESLPGILRLGALACGVIFIVWTMNAFNFMDGSHGMAGFQGLTAGLVLAWLFARAGEPAWTLVSLMLAGACLGFLPWNSPRPRIFMGDSGSVPLGLAFGTLLVIGLATHSMSAPVAALVLGIFMVDASLTLARRVVSGEQWYTPHRQHLYQRLIGKGWTHGQVLVLYQAVYLLVLIPGIAAGTLYPRIAWPLSVLLLGSLAITWCVLTVRLGSPQGNA